MQIGKYIRRQPATLTSLPAAIGAELDGFVSLRQTPQRIVLLGTGSSMNALLAGAEALEEGTGASVIAKEPEAFLRLPPKASDQRTLVLALKLGAAHLLERRFTAPPVLLLDDIFGELDLGRRAALLAALPAAAQKIITTTHLDWRPADIEASVIPLRS